MNTNEPFGTVIIGGGITGLSIAAHLAKKGLRDIVLVERNTSIGTGETAASAAMIMANTLEDDPRRIRMASAANKANERDSLGIGLGITRCGSVLVSTTVEGATRLRRQVEIQNENGIDTIFLDRDGLRQVVPLLDGSDITGGIYCPTDGYVDQMDLVRRLSSFARAHGVQIFRDIQISRLSKSVDGMVNIWESTEESVQARRVVIAAGAWSPELVSTLGFRRPLVYSARTLWSGTPNKFVNIPIVEFIDGPDAEYYMRPTQDGRYIVGVGPTREFSHYPTEPIASFIKDYTESLIARRFPVLGIRDLVGIVGIRAMTEDGLPYLGPLDSDGRIILACGVAPYGITDSQTIAEFIAEYMAEGRISNEMESCSPNRESLFPQGGIEHER